METTLLREIWKKAHELGFQFNETDAGEMSNTVKAWLKSNVTVKLRDNDDITDNEIIANFIGRKIRGNSDDKMGFTPHDYWVFPWDESLYTPDQMKFKTQWHWIMPVVELIESLEFTFIIDNNQANIMSDSDPDKGLILKEYPTKIESVYYSVVAFIKWYTVRDESK